MTAVESIVDFKQEQTCMKELIVKDSESFGTNSSTINQHLAISFEKFGLHDKDLALGIRALFPQNISKRLSSVNLSHALVGVRCAVELARWLKMGKFNQLLEFNLSGCFLLTPTHLEMICVSLSKSSVCRSLTALNLSQNFALSHSEASTALETALDACTQLKFLNLSYCSLRDGNIRILARPISRIQKLRELNLSHNQLTSESVDFLVEEWEKAALICTCQLENLNMSFQGLDSCIYYELDENEETPEFRYSSTWDISRLLSVVSSITSLSLDHLPLTAGHRLVERLMKCSNLSVLSLAYLKPPFSVNKSTEHKMQEKSEFSHQEGIHSLQECSQQLEKLTLKLQKTWKDESTEWLWCDLSDHESEEEYKTSLDENKCFHIDNRFQTSDVLFQVWKKYQERNLFDIVKKELKCQSICCCFSMNRCFELF